MLCLKNSRTDNGSLSIVFCYTLEFANLVTNIRNPKETFLVSCGLISKKQRTKTQKQRTKSLVFYEKTCICPLLIFEIE